MRNIFAELNLSTNRMTTNCAAFIIDIINNSNPKFARTDICQIQGEDSPNRVSAQLPEEKGKVYFTICSYYWRRENSYLNPANLSFVL